MALYETRFEHTDQERTGQGEVDGGVRVWLRRGYVCEGSEGALKERERVRSITFDGSSLWGGRAARILYLRELDRETSYDDRLFVKAPAYGVVWNFDLVHVAVIVVFCMTAGLIGFTIRFPCHENRNFRFFKFYIFTEQDFMVLLISQRRKILIFTYTLT